MKNRKKKQQKKQAKHMQFYCMDCGELLSLEWNGFKYLFE